MNENYIGKNVLITTENWFYAPDGLQYKAVWGTLIAIKTAETTLGIRPNGRSTNWYVEIGDITVAGCQVNYAVATDSVNFDDVEDAVQVEGRWIKSKRPTFIYNANKEPK